MASSSGASSSVGTEFTVIVPKDSKKVFNVLRFAGSADVPNMLKNRKMLMKREDNCRQQPQQAAQAGDGKEAMPKTGAGSEFGREEREERFRRLRGGRTLRKYSPDDQPWIVSFPAQQPSTSKDVKPPVAPVTTRPRRFRGLREAGATENSSWFIFARRPDSSFVALPVSDWYGLTVMAHDGHLNSEEVEEEVQKRKKTINFFALMLQKRLKNQDMEPGELEAQIKEETSSGKGGRRGMHLTDLDAEWVDEDEEEAEEDEEGEKAPKSAEDGGGKIADADAELVQPPPGGKKKVNKKKAAEILRQKKRIRSKSGGDEESEISDSDEGDFDGREMDYMTSSGAESELDDTALPEETKGDVEAAETEERGVEDEEGLRKLNDSAEEDEEGEEETKDSKEDEMDLDEKESRSRQGLSSSDSEEKDESGKDEDSDLDDIEKLESGRQVSGGNNSKRRLPAEVITASGKRVRLELPSSTAEPGASSISATSTSAPTKKSGGSDIDSQLEQAIRHYLSRTPMSATQLVEKFLQKARAASASGGNAPPSHDDLAKRIAAIILRLKPEQIRSNNTVYFSLSPDKSS